MFRPVFERAGPALASPGTEPLGFVFGVYQAPGTIGDRLQKAGLSPTDLVIFDVTLDPVRIYPDWEPRPDRGAVAPPGQLDATARDAVLIAAAGTSGAPVASSIEFAGRRWEMEFSLPPQFGLSPVERNVWLIVLSAGLALASAT